MKHFFTAIIVLTSCKALALPEYLITLDPAVGDGVLNQTETAVRELSRTTGTGLVTKTTRILRLFADLSADAAKDVEGLPGVTQVRAEVQFQTMKPDPRQIPMPSARTADNVHRSITFKADLPEHDRRALMEEIRRLARATGSGHFVSVNEDTVVANLSSKAKRDVAAMSGVAAVEDERGTSTQTGCGPDFAGR